MLTYDEMFDDGADDDYHDHAIGMMNTHVNIRMSIHMAKKNAISGTWTSSQFD